MGIGTSLLLIAVGAIMRFAITTSTSGFSIHTAGVILMIIGAIGLLISLVWLTAFADRHGRSAVLREPVIRERVRERDVL